MTQYPEVVLAKELGICYLNISLVTDYDTGLKSNPKIKAVVASEVIKLFNKNLSRLKTRVSKIIASSPNQLKCNCAHSLEEAVLN